MTTETDTREQFREAVAGPLQTADLARVALLIAAESYPGLDVAQYLQRIDALAEEAKGRLEGTDDAMRVGRLIEFLGRERGFTGNQDDYYDLRNSYLNEVLDRRTGIPITLALLYVEVGRQVGLDIQGISFPGHFLAVHRGSTPTIIDPFFGTALDEAACTERLRATMGPDAEIDERMLEVASPQQILIRMLSNLKLIHLRARDFAAALSCSERILLIHPDLANEIRDRAALYLQLECFDAARADLERFLEIAPQHESAELVRNELVKLRQSGPILH